MLCGVGVVCGVGVLNIGKIGATCQKRPALRRDAFEHVLRRATTSKYFLPLAFQPLIEVVKAPKRGGLSNAGWANGNGIEELGDFTQMRDRGCDGSQTMT